MAYDILFLIIGLLVGAVICWWIASTKQKKSNDLSQRTIGDLNVKLSAYETELRITKEHQTADKTKIASLETEIDTLEDENRSLNAAVVAQNKEIELKEKQLIAADERIQKEMQMVQERMTNITTELLKARSTELEKSNTLQLGNVVKPLQEQIQNLQELVHATRENNVRNTESVKAQIENMMKRSREMSDETTRLANALTHRSKFQGDLGETVLDNVLSSAGLREGRDYEMQEFIRTETGQVVTDEDTGHRLQPDVILHFPDKKDAIIDSKLSLTAYMQYVNADDERQRDIALNMHLDSVRKHVDELARKDYSKYIEKPNTTFDFVIMFMPFEGAFQAAMNADPQLWSYAFNKGVCIAGELNISVILRMIKLSWTQFEQTKNQQQVFKAADELIQRIGLLHDRVVTAQKSLDATQDKFEDIMKSIDGRQGITTSAQKIVALGAKDDKRIPRSIEQEIQQDEES
ncbi:MAG: DNA recombination protein RmuC [Prevotella sp.]|nr:DNA recombination protein RmuC [Prevotella sp.]MBR1464383.1 DNA recombination protein RmuC [Prevotella sp.]